MSVGPPRQVTDFPHRVRKLDPVWIPMPDGARLAATVWLPRDAAAHPVPAILEYIPYRRRDFTALRDSLMHPYFAGHGYASVRVDLRGAGDSDGVMTDEYTAQELDDGYHVVQWLATQAWCSGRVGMIGISWGGFNGLQVAALRPPALGAVVSVCSSDDRYADDIHHMGGCLLGDSLSWASVMFAYNSLPPDPVIVGSDRWRDMWQTRIDGSGLWLEKWLRHQRRDAYWQHGSICEEYDAVTTPVLAVSGWTDGYTNSVFRMLANLKGPRMGLVGPWGHKYPHIGVPGPAIGFLQECLRWWDRWLKDSANGIDDEPMLRVWMQDYVPPIPFYRERPGRWVAERSWPSPRITTERYGFRPLRLVPGEETGVEDVMDVQSPLTLGLFAGKWCSYAAAPDLPHDQREEDGGALVFDSDPLEETREILGAPQVTLELSASQPIAQVAVRLSDVAPDGPITRISYGLLNLTHRHSHARPELLEPGEVIRVTVQLNDIAQIVPQGHRLRIAISTSYWPLAWPPPYPVRLSVHPGACRLDLPVRPVRAEDADLRRFDWPETARPLRHTWLKPEDVNWYVHRDLRADRSTLEVADDEGEVRLDDRGGLAVLKDVREFYSCLGNDFTSPMGEVTQTRRLQRGDWRVTSVTHTRMSVTPTSFVISADLNVHEGERRFANRTWDLEIARDHL